MAANALRKAQSVVRQNDKIAVGLFLLIVTEAAGTAASGLPPAHGAQHRLHIARGQGGGAPQVLKAEKRAVGGHLRRVQGGGQETEQLFLCDGQFANDQVLHQLTLLRASKDLLVFRQTS